METLSRWVAFEILSRLDIPNINRIRQVSKYWSTICHCKEFWTFKMWKETGKTYYSSQVTIAGKIWYERQRHAGQLHIVPESILGPGPVSDLVKVNDLDNICYFACCYDRKYYVDVKGTLYYMDESKFRHLNYGFKSHRYDPPKRLIGCGIGSLVLELTTVPIKINQIDNVKKILPTNIGDLILTLDYRLYTIGFFVNQPPDKLVLTQTNVKNIGGDRVLCFYLTFDGNLWAYLPKFGAYGVDLISHDVKSACVMFEDEELFINSKICYLTNFNELYIRDYEKVQKIMVDFVGKIPYAIFSTVNMLWWIDEDHNSFNVGRLFSVKLCISAGRLFEPHSQLSTDVFWPN